MCPLGVHAGVCAPEVTGLSGNPSKKATMSASQESEVLISGDRVRHSGLYWVEHGAEDAQRDIFIVKGAQLPRCPECGDVMKFTLVQKIPYIAEDPDFC
jgi:hypothetical protein